MVEQHPDQQRERFVHQQPIGVDIAGDGKRCAGHGEIVGERRKSGAGPMRRLPTTRRFRYPKLTTNCGAFAPCRLENATKLLPAFVSVKLYWPAAVTVVVTSNSTH